MQWSDSADLVEIGLLVFGGWLTAWSSLWSVAEPCVRIVEVGSEILWPVLQ
jgi:hypothetical protein